MKKLDRSSFSDGDCNKKSLEFNITEDDNIQDCQCGDTTAAADPNDFDFNDFIIYQKHYSDKKFFYEICHIASELNVQNRRLALGILQCIQILQHSPSPEGFDRTL